MASRILACCDAVKDLIVGSLDWAEPDRIKRAYRPKFEGESWAGWRVWIFPMAYRDSERLSRHRVEKEMRVGVEVEIKYPEAGQADEEGLVPVEWVDEQVRVVEEDIFDLLNDTGVRKATLLASRFRTESCEMVAVADPVRLHEDKVFHCLVEIVYTEPVTG